MESVCVFAGDVNPLQALGGVRNKQEEYLLAFGRRSEGRAREGQRKEGERENKGETEGEKYSREIARGLLFLRRSVQRPRARKL
jgi:hypothetical protein